MAIVSVIIPVYNVCNYLRACVESVEAQSFTEREIILVDDGSTDNSGTLCDNLATEFKDIKVIHKSNGGLSSARNAGLKEASGAYVIFLDSDDFWVGTDSLSQLMKTVQIYDADIVRGEYLTVDDKGVRSYHEHKIEDKPADVVLSSKDMYTKVIKGEFFSWLFLFKASAIRDMLFNESQLFQEDIDFAIRLFCKELKCIYTPLRFYAYRKREGSLITTSSIRQLKYSFILADTFDEYAEKARETGLTEEYHRSSVMMYYWTLCTLSSEQFSERRTEIIKELNLSALQLRTARRSVLHRVVNKHIVVLFTPPTIGSWLIRTKLSIYNYIRPFFSRIKTQN